MIDLKVVLNLLIKNILFISLFTIFGALSSVAISLHLNNVYSAEAVLGPPDKTYDLFALDNSISSFASIGGLFSGAADKNTFESIEILKSFVVFRELLLKNDTFKEDLLAIEKWDPKSNTIIYDQDLYDVTQKRWVRKFKFPLEQVPSDQELYRVFREDVLNISVDSKSGFVNVSVDHYSPFIAKKWLEDIITETNKIVSKREKLVALRSTEFLYETLNTIQLKEVREKLSELTQKQTERLMLAEASDQLAFKVISPPYLPLFKSSPNRALICIFGTLMFFFLAAAFTIIRFFLNEKS